MQSWLTWTNVKNTFWTLLAIGIMIAFFNLVAALPVFLGAILFYGVTYAFEGRRGRGSVHGDDRGATDSCD